MQQTLEKRLSVQQLLFLITQPQNNRAAEYIGKAVAQSRIVSPAFFRDVCSVWAHHARRITAPSVQPSEFRGVFGGDLSEEELNWVAMHIDEAPHYIALYYADRIFETEMTRCLAPKETPANAHKLLNLLRFTAQSTRFDKTNDGLILHNVSLLLPPDMLALVSLSGSPVDAATELLGQELNHRIRPLIDTPVAEQFDSVSWATSTRPCDFVLAAMLVIELIPSVPGHVAVEIGTVQTCEHSTVVPSLLVSPLMGYKIARRCFEIDKGVEFPIICLLLSFVRSCVALGFNPASEVITAIDSPQDLSPLSIYYPMVFKS